MGNGVDFTSRSLDLPFAICVFFCFDIHVIKCFKLGFLSCESTAMLTSQTAHLGVEVVAFIPSCCLVCVI